MNTKNKLTLIVLFAIYCLSCKSQGIHRIEVKYIDFSIEMPFSISCENFERFFLGDIDTISIKDKRTIDCFSKIIKETKKSGLSDRLPPDTRVKIEVIYNNKKTIMCIGQQSVSIYDKLYFISEAMIDFMEKSNKSIGHLVISTPINIYITQKEIIEFIEGIVKDRSIKRY